MKLKFQAHWCILDIKTMNGLKKIAIQIHKKKKSVESY